MKSINDIISLIHQKKTKLEAPQGFIRNTYKKRLSFEETSKLNNKGIAALNQKDLNLAERIFRTTENVQGLERVADNYAQKREAIKAANLYLEFKQTKKLEKTCEQIAASVRLWLNE